MLRIKIPRRLKNTCIHCFATLSIIITGFFFPIVASGEITLLSPGINIADPVDESLAVTDKFTVFKWSSTSPQDSTSSYIIEFSSNKDFSIIVASVDVNTVPESERILSRNESQTIVNVAYGFENFPNFFPAPAEAIYWRVRLQDANNPDELSPVFFTFYRWQQIAEFSIILGQVVSSDVIHSQLSAANITIVAESSAILLGNEPDNMIALSTDDDGRFLGYAVSFVDSTVVADSLPFPLKIIVQRPGFKEEIMTIKSRAELDTLNTTCDTATPENPGTCFILTPEPPPPPLGKVTLVPIYQLLLGTKTP